MNKISRRQFLKMGAVGLGALAFNKITPTYAYLPEFPIKPRLGRVFNLVDVKAKPDPNSATISTQYNDSIIVCQREVVGNPFNSFWKSRLWYETPEGYIPSISVQPVKNEPNQPIKELPNYGESTGMWVEVTVPYVDLILDGAEPRSPKLAETEKPRFYYSMVLWVDGIKDNGNGEVLYHVIEKHGSYGDKFWADARAFRPITPEDISAISPGIENKKIVVDVRYQTLSCFENDKEILFSRVSTGAKHDNEGNEVDNWKTPIGDYHAINRKYISLHMAGGTSKASGYEEFAVSWTSIFASGGVAIHSTYWHNNYGELLSHGCVNAPPEIAKFIYRWSQPQAPYESGIIEIQGYSGTSVQVKEN